MASTSRSKRILKGEKIKALLLISGLMYGGGQKVVLDLLREAQRRNELDVQLTLLGCRESVLQQAAAHVIPYDGRYNRLTTLLPTAWRLRTQLKDSRPAVIHTHGWDADIIGWLSILGSTTRQIIHLHITSEWLGSSRLTHRVRRFLTRLAFARRGTVLVAVSNAVRRHWARRLPWDAETIVTVHNGVDAEYYTEIHSREGLARKMPTIGVVARLAPMKGIEYLLEATAELAAQYPAIRLRIAGEGHLKEDLQNRASKLGLAGKVEFLGRVQDMKSFYGSINVLVLPSISTEGLPLVVLEAMAAALPIVATTVGGTPEVVRDGQDGFLVPPKDVKALTNALQKLLIDEVGCRRMGKNARQHVYEKFSLTKFAGAIFATYLNAV